MKKLLIFIFLLAVFFRFYNFTDNFYFGHDQARDLHEVYNIVVLKDIKIVGPGTDIPGLFCGPLYYYLLAIAYFVSNFNPNAGVVMQIMFNLTGVGLLYYFGSVLKDKKLGLIAAFLWAVSFEQTNFARWLSNPAVVSITSIIFFLGLYLYFYNKKQFGLPLSVIGYGLGTQLDFYIVYLGIFYPIFFYIHPLRPKKKTIIISLASLILLFISFLLSELRFKFLGLQSLLGFMSEQKSFVSIFASLDTFFTSLSRSIYYSFFGFNNFLGLLLFLFIVIILIKKEGFSKPVNFLFIWVLSTFPLFGFTKTNIVGGNFIHVSIQGGLTLLVAFAIHVLFSMKKNAFAWALIVIIFAGNIMLFINDSFQASHVLGHQKWTYKEQKEVVDYTYTASSKKPFSICSVSNPLFINIHWSAVYKINGEQKYGYLPTWSGPIQRGSNTFLSYDDNVNKIRYLILDPSHQLDPLVYKATVYAEDQISVLDETKQFGNIIVQKRHIPDNTNDLRNTQELSPTEMQNIEYLLKADGRYRCVNL